MGDVPQDTGVMFEVDGRDDPPEVAMSTPVAKIGRFANTPVRRVENVQRVTRIRTTLPADIPPRPPGGGNNAPSAARHAWRVPEKTSITAVVDPIRPEMLPRTNVATQPPPRPIASPYVIFGENPFSPVVSPRARQLYATPQLQVREILQDPHVRHFTRSA
eukprot:TRINITY_DN28193_c0_g1_i1.p1 TRINITY_DN28193_c0_g1~~TRINITY_DN28193_c0_g1_i1.p1  ORF type:complete len:161 (+),score=30.19 TRINITY_DN28193_c0_g1_i1:55-537(+)